MFLAHCTVFRERQESLSTDKQDVLASVVKFLTWTILKKDESKQYEQDNLKYSIETHKGISCLWLNMFRIEQSNQMNTTCFS